MSSLGEPTLKKLLNAYFVMHTVITRFLINSTDFQIMLPSKNSKENFQTFPKPAASKIKLEKFSDFSKKIVISKFSCLSKHFQSSDFLGKIYL